MQASRAGTGCVPRCLPPSPPGPPGSVKSHFTGGRGLSAGDVRVNVLYCPLGFYVWAEPGEGSHVHGLLSY